MGEESLLDVMKEQYNQAENKQELDYWKAFSQIIMESIELRASMGLSQTDLAEKMRTRQSVISRFENMDRLPNYDFIARMAAALGHTLGITLYGDYMAVVPLTKQELVRKMAVEAGKNPQQLLQEAIDEFIEKMETIQYSTKILDFPVKFDGPPSLSFENKPIEGSETCPMNDQSIAG